MAGAGRAAGAGLGMAGAGRAAGAGLGMAGAGRAAWVALTLVMALAVAACGAGSAADGEDASVADGPEESAPAADEGDDRAVVQVPPPAAAFLDPGADPRTELGRLRAQYLPVWTPDLDWAFPPEACDSAWELDGIAEPTPGADIAVLGDFATAAALAVMRYEHQLSRALADPNPLAQLCVAVASVDPARAQALARLESHLVAGTPRSRLAGLPRGGGAAGRQPHLGARGVLRGPGPCRPSRRCRRLGGAGRARGPPGRLPAQAVAGP